MCRRLRSSSHVTIGNGRSKLVNYREFTFCKFCYNALRFTPGGFFMEIHHIVPRCVGGENTRKNMILLSPVAHAIISVYQSEHYQRPCFHRRQLKYLPEELLELGQKWVTENARRANAARKNTKRSDECRRKQKESALKPSAQPAHKKAAQSRAVSETNSKKSPCPQCGMLMNVGNLTKHLKGTRCKGKQQ